MPRVETFGDCTLHLGDCRDLVPMMSDLQAIITDPPYGIGLETNKPSRVVRPYWAPHSDQRVARATDHQFDRVIGDDAPFDPAFLLSFPNLVLWGANHYASKLPDSACWFSWDKKVGKAADSTIGDCELAWTRGLPFQTVRAFRHMWAGFQRDSQVGEARLHPTEKPIALMEWCCGFFPKINIFLDPFMGSGCVGVACVRLGKGFVGIEIHEPYFDIACRRIEQASRQGDMLRDLPPKAKQDAFL